MFLETHRPPQNNSENRCQGEEWIPMTELDNKACDISKANQRISVSFLCILISNAFAAHLNLKTKVKGIKRIKIVRVLIGTFFQKVLFDPQYLPLINPALNSLLSCAISPSSYV